MTELGLHLGESSIATSDRIGLPCISSGPST
jgi:hypothetical protein